MGTSISEYGTRNFGVIQMNIRLSIYEPSIQILPIELSLHEEQI